MTGARLFDTIVVVDWSARSRPSPERPTRDAIFWCTVSLGEVQPVAYARTRSEARRRLSALIRDERRQDRRVLLGFDFPFGYPAGVAETLTGQPSGLALWAWLAERIEDGCDNANNRYAVASQINRHYPGLGPAWGRPAAWAFPDIPTRASSRHGSHPPERRLADGRAKGAKTVWQLAYAGSVGSQVLLGLPTLLTLRALTGAAVWPFDTGLAAPNHPLVIAEVYPSLLQRQAHADRAADEPLDAAQVRVNARALARLDAVGALSPLFAADLSRKDRDTVEREEAWILGLGHEDRLRAAA
ncbi:MAG: hypothetical protein QNJ44_07280 [Rhodobacter sp.]|nr:hypothetical protein [Rhodobacter sp.]